MSVCLSGLTAGRSASRYAGCRGEAKPWRRNEEAYVDYHEPWSATEVGSWKLGFQTPPKHGRVARGTACCGGRLGGRRDKAEKNADVLIMGSRMTEAAVMPSLLGNLVYVR